jgi:hypothetical protein
MKVGHCTICGGPFVGGNRRKFCSMRCKRRLEGQRRSWDHLSRVVRHLRIAATQEDLYTPVSAKNTFTVRKSWWRNWERGHDRDSQIPLWQQRQINRAPTRKTGEVENEKCGDSGTGKDGNITR